MSSPLQRHDSRSRSKSKRNVQGQILLRPASVAAPLLIGARGARPTGTHSRFDNRLSRREWHARATLAKTLGMRESSRRRTCILKHIVEATVLPAGAGAPRRCLVQPAAIKNGCALYQLPTVRHVRVRRQLRAIYWFFLASSFLSARLRSDRWVIMAPLLSSHVGALSYSQICSACGQ